LYCGHKKEFKILRVSSQGNLTEVSYVT